MDKSCYGASNHYTGNNGVNYFEWQKGIGIKTAKIESRKFSKFIEKSDIVMDFGCGGGYILSRLNCKKRLGIEINDAARAEAYKNGIDAHKDISSIEKDSVDIVISNHCLEHVPYPIEALKQIRECIKPAGKLLLCVPIDDWRTQKTFDKNDINNHLYTWTVQSIGNCLLESGYSINSIRIIPFYISPRKPDMSMLPLPLYFLLCNLYSLIFKSRQIFVIAHKD